MESRLPSMNDIIRPVLPVDNDDFRSRLETNFELVYMRHADTPMDALHYDVLYFLFINYTYGKSFNLEKDPGIAEMILARKSPEFLAAYPAYVKSIRDKYPEVKPEVLARYPDVEEKLIATLARALMLHIMKDIVPEASMENIIQEIGQKAVFNKNASMLELCKLCQTRLGYHPSEHSPAIRPGCTP